MRNDVMRRLTGSLKPCVVVLCMALLSRGTLLANIRRDVNPDYANIQASLQQWMQIPEQRTNVVSRLANGLWTAGTPKVLQEIRSSAEGGNAKAQCLLGLAYVYAWWGASTNAQEARLWLRKASDQNIPDADVGLAALLLHGVGGETNTVEALRLFQRAAEAQSAAGQFYVGVCFHFGYGTPVDYIKARRCYELADQAGFVPAACNLGMLYDGGLGVPRDPAKALELYRRCGARGFSMAMHNVGVSYARGEGVRQDFTEAAKWYRRAATLGYVPSQHNLGNALLNGRGVQLDVQEAAKWLRKSADAGITESLAIYAMLVLKGDVPGNATNAIADLKRAAEAGDQLGNAVIGCMYARLAPTNVSNLVQEDDSRGVAMLRVSAEVGNPTAQRYLGSLCVQGRGTPRDLAEAYKWLTLAERAGELSAAADLRELRRDISPSQLVEGIRRVRAFKVSAPFGGQNPEQFLPGVPANPTAK